MRADRTRFALLVTSATVAILAPLPGTHGTALALSIWVPSPATFGTSLGTSGTSDTAGGDIVVTAVGQWRVRASGTDNGKLRRAGACTQGSLLLSNPLKMFATGAPTNYGTSANPLTLTSTPQLVAAGNPFLLTVDTFTLTYRYTPSASDQLTAGCAYSETTTIDLSSS